MERVQTCNGKAMDQRQKAEGPAALRLPISEHKNSLSGVREAEIHGFAHEIGTNGARVRLVNYNFIQEVEAAGGMGHEAHVAGAGVDGRAEEHVALRGLLNLVRDGGHLRKVFSIGR